jgi:hypothetical protein
VIAGGNNPFTTLNLQRPLNSGTTDPSDGRNTPH